MPPFLYQHTQLFIRSYWLSILRMPYIPTCLLHTSHCQCSSSGVPSIPQNCCGTHQLLSAASSLLSSNPSYIVLSELFLYSTKMALFFHLISVSSFLDLHEVSVIIRPNFSPVQTAHHHSSFHVSLPLLFVICQWNA